MDSVAKRVIPLAALVVLGVGAVPLIRGVHGRPKTALDYEARDLRGRVEKVIAKCLAALKG
jgi:hypothetical protein